MADDGPPASGDPRRPRISTTGGTPGHRLSQFAERTAVEGYGAPEAPGSAALGYRPEARRRATVPIVEPTIAATPFAGIPATVDAVVIGAGAGGGVAACVLAEAGLSVLIVERGTLDAGSRDHLRTLRAPVTGAEPGPGAGERRWWGDVALAEPTDPRWQVSARTVGGGTRVFQGMAWRWPADDFAMATRYGVPDGSSLADWPLTRADLDPHYAWVEHEVGVAGDATAHPGVAPEAGYPMPPMPPTPEHDVLGRAAAELGLRAGPVPLLLNTVPRAGRAECVDCGECVGFACRSVARNGTRETVLPRALAAGARLVTGAIAARITVDATGTVDGVELVEAATGARTQVRAGHVVVAAGAIETARLLLASTSAAHPVGLGNGTDQVGRHLQGHAIRSAFGLHPDELLDHHGPGAVIGTLDGAHDGTVLGGGVITSDAPKLPILHWRWCLPPDAPRSGPAGDAAMRDTYRRTLHLLTQAQEVPLADNRVTLAAVTDRHGVPEVRLAGTVHPETLRSSAHLVALATRWLAAAGATRTWNDAEPHGLLAGYHQAGTCRMGTDPATSVVGPDGRVHGHPNLWVADASVHVTNGSANPALTIMALAHRTAGRIVTA